LWTPRFDLWKTVFEPKFRGKKFMNEKFEFLKSANGVDDLFELIVGRLRMGTDIEAFDYHELLEPGETADFFDGKSAEMVDVALDFAFGEGGHWK
jgi:hypothetical protein